MLISYNSLAQSAAINASGAPADGSAALDIASTAKGVLIPRMTAAQRTAISSPATGLMVYQTDAPAGYYFYNGTLWKPFASGSTSHCNYAIGQNVTALGGYIFYLDSSSCHGLVCAPADQSTGIQWYNGSYTNTTAFGDCVGCGAGNTSMIIYNQGATATNYAAGLARACTVGGFSDWYLPSRYELNLMYQNIGQGNLLGLGNVGGFSSNYYWSSTELVGNFAWIQNFGSGVQFSGYAKSATLYVRAVRAF